ncbi:MerC mercury resistance protein [Pirellula sp. SH-Sr6A]|uniref:MerC domain-containing protein n=1 Tax=Pirellula sp. SH-Sr6A TaxID=1632865 RepID=UPI00078D9E1C|nr:MerC domain-containing protein [Pirellula sp. SH-Sr6A]AMV30669.1 MerC mercury resistance protein [Pirellula sp. SH-Sr6A]
MEKSGSQWKDRMGIAASALCAVHCAATPVLLAFLPTLQFTEWMASPLFHQIAAIICVSIVSVSILPAYRRFGDIRVLTLSGAGLGMILAAAFLLPDHCCSPSDLSHAGHAHATPHDEENCPYHDHSQGTSLSHDPGSPETFVASAGFSGLPWETIQPWMTPIGGALLILAHFMNLRRSFGGCSSKCACPRPEEAIEELPTAQAA